MGHCFLYRRYYACVCSEFMIFCLSRILFTKAHLILNIQLIKYHVSGSKFTSWDFEGQVARILICSYKYCTAVMHWFSSLSIIMISSIKCRKTLHGGLGKFVLPPPLPGPWKNSSIRYCPFSALFIAIFRRLILVFWYTTK